VSEETNMNLPAVWEHAGTDGQTDDVMMPIVVDHIRSAKTWKNRVKFAF